MRQIALTLSSIMVCGAFLACESQTRPSVAALVAPVNAQESTTPGAPAFRFTDGSGMYSEGRWLFIRGGNGTHYGPVAIAGALHFASMQGSGVRHLCVDGNNAVYASASGCRSESDELADLRREVQELRAMVAANHR